MTKKLLLALCLLSACERHTPEQKQIIAFVETHANDPGSYEPISFRFLGPATYANTGRVATDSTRIGDLYEHTYRAKNGFGALTLHTTVFALTPGAVDPLPDSLAERAQLSFRP